MVLVVYSLYYCQHLLISSKSWLFYQMWSWHCQWSICIFMNLLTFVKMKFLDWLGGQESYRNTSIRGQHGLWDRTRDYVLKCCLVWQLDILISIGNQHDLWDKAKPMRNQTYILSNWWLWSNGWKPVCKPPWQWQERNSRHYIYP